MVATLIGIDVGTTATKAVLIDLNGSRLAEFSRPHSMARRVSGAAEQDPADWMRSVHEALGQFAALNDLRGLRGIGVCSQVNTHVFIDAGGRPVRPAITWQDGRAGEDGASIDALVTEQQKLEWFGGPMPIDASHALARIAFVARTEPEVFARSRHVLLPKDYVVMQLTGALGSDPISAVGLVDRNGYIDPLIGLVPGALERLPPLFPFTHIAGKVKPGLPGAGTPVVVGAMDAWGGMFGVGVASNGQAMLQSGTSEIAGVVSSKIVPTRGVILFPSYERITMHAAPTQAGGAALQWLSNLLNASPSMLSDLVRSTEPSAAVPVFLPHLQGERAPIWDSISRGVFARIDGRTDAALMARAVMEGVGFSVRWAFDALQSSSGRLIEVANLGGGGSRSEVWSQIKADILGIELRRATVSDSAALGGAILAGVGAGTMSSVGEAIQELVRFDRSFEPRADHRRFYDDRFMSYRELYDSLRALNRREAELEG